MLAGNSLVSPCPHIPQKHGAQAIEHLLPLIQARTLKPRAAPSCLLDNKPLCETC